MIATIGFILAIGLLVYMIIRGIDMITATVVTAAVILVTSGLNVWERSLSGYPDMFFFPRMNCTII